MSYSQSTYRSKTYREFKVIEAAAYRQIIHFYEKEAATIEGLEFEEHFEMTTAYVNALFEVGAYHKHLALVDSIIEAAITNNISFYKGEDIFLKMLFRKAASLYNLFEYDQSEYILREIVRINPWENDAVQFLKKCLRSRQPRYVQYARASSIFLFLTAALVIALEVLFIRSFYPEQSAAAEQTRLVLFGLGGLILVGGDLFHRLRVEQHVNDFVYRIRRQKDGL